MATEVHHGGQPLYPYLFGIGVSPVPGRRAVGGRSAEAPAPSTPLLPLLQLAADAGDRAEAPLAAKKVRPWHELRRHHASWTCVTTFPYRHLDRTRRAGVADLAVGDEGGGAGQCCAAPRTQLRRAHPGRPAPGRGRGGTDPSGQQRSATVVFFNQPWRAKQLGVGTQVLLSGRVRPTFRGTRQMVNPR